MTKLLSIGKDAKTIKGQKYGYLTGVLYLAPHKVSSHLVCPSASPGCIEACLFTAGRGGMQTAIHGRIRKTRLLFEEKETFLLQLQRDIAALVRKAEREGLIPLVRLNGTSDLAWEKMKLNGRSLMELFPEVQFYDYTKIRARADKFARGNMPENYSLVFSLTESNDADARKVLAAGAPIAAVFGGALPDTFLGAPVINGDEHDARVENMAAVVVGLSAKGRAKHDTSGFVRYA
jgi:hypothetical protein